MLWVRGALSGPPLPSGSLGAEAEAFHRRLRHRKRALDTTKLVRDTTTCGIFAFVSFHWLAPRKRYCHTATCKVHRRQGVEGTEHGFCQGRCNLQVQAQLLKYRTRH